nr:hypothetical protein [Tanacetum cinerariifolium]
MGEPLLPDRMFDFPMDEPEPQPAYDFVLETLPGYADEPMVCPLVDEFAEPIVEMEGHVFAPVIDMEEDIAMLFGDGNFNDDVFEGFKDKEKVWEMNEEWLMALVTPPPMPVVPPPSTYKVGGPSTAAAEGPSFTLLTPGFHVSLSVIADLSTRMGNLKYEHGQLVKKVIQVSDAEVADGIIIWEIGPRVSTVEGQLHVDKLEQVRTQVEQGQQTATQRDEVISKMSQHVLALLVDVQQRDS